MNATFFQIEIKLIAICEDLAKAAELISQSHGNLLALRGVPDDETVPVKRGRKVGHKMSEEAKRKMIATRRRNKKAREAEE